MRYFLYTLCTLSILFTGCIPDRQTFAPKPEQHVFVRKIIDGDTIEIQRGEVIERVRLIGLDAPEVDECGFVEAALALEKSIDQQYIALQSDTITEDTDKYGRLLRYVRSTKGDMSLWMITEGYARDFPAFAHSRSDAYREAESLARASGLGLWNMCNQ